MNHFLTMKYWISILEFLNYLNVNESLKELGHDQIKQLSLFYMPEQNVLIVGGQKNNLVSNKNHEDASKRYSPLQLDLKSVKYLSNLNLWSDYTKPWMPDGWILLQRKICPWLYPLCSWNPQPKNIYLYNIG